jgi:hypothetical protein
MAAAIEAGRAILWLWCKISSLQLLLNA